MQVHIEQVENLDAIFRWRSVQLQALGVALRMEELTWEGAVGAPAACRGAAPGRKRRGRADRHIGRHGSVAALPPHEHQSGEREAEAIGCGFGLQASVTVAWVCWLLAAGCWLLAAAAHCVQPCRSIT